MNNIYIGNRYVPIFKEWSEGSSYEALTMVSINGSTYISKVPVPPNTPITDDNYWALMYATNPQIDSIKDEFETFTDNINRQVEQLTKINGTVWTPAASLGIKPENTAADNSAALAAVPNTVTNIGFSEGVYNFNTTENLDLTQFSIFCPRTVTFNVPITASVVAGVLPVTPTGSISNSLIIWDIPTVTFNPFKADNVLYLGPSTLPVIPYRYGYYYNCNFIIPDSLNGGITVNKCTIDFVNLSNLNSITAYESKIDTRYCQGSTTVTAVNCDIIDDRKLTISKAINCKIQGGPTITYANGCKFYDNPDFNPAIVKFGVGCEGELSAFMYDMKACNLTCSSSNTSHRGSPVSIQDSILTLSQPPAKLTSAYSVQGNTYKVASGAPTSVKNWDLANNTSFTNCNFPRGMSFTGSRLCFINCKAENATFPSDAILINTPLGSGIPTPPTPEPVDSGNYTFAWGNTSSSTFSFLSPGLHPSNISYPPSFSIQIWKDGSPCTEQGWELNSIWAYNAFNMSTTHFIKTTETINNNFFKFNYPVNYVARRNLLVLAVFTNSSLNKNLYFFGPNNSSTPMNNMSTGGGQLLFKNKLYEEGTRVAVPTLELHPQVGGGLSFKVCDSYGCPVLLDRITIYTSYTQSTSPAITYDSSTQQHSLANCPTENFQPYYASVTFHYSGNETYKFYMNNIPVRVQPV